MKCKLFLLISFAVISAGGVLYANTNNISKPKESVFLNGKGFQNHIEDKSDCFDKGSVTIMSIEPKEGAVLTQLHAQTFTATIKYSFRGNFPNMELSFSVVDPFTAFNLDNQDSHHSIALSSNNGVATLSTTADLTVSGKPVKRVWAIAGLWDDSFECAAVTDLVSYNVRIGGDPSGKCLSSSLLSNEDDLQSLRKFRDGSLSNSLKGIGLITLYYKHSAEVIKILDSNPDLKLRATNALKELVEVTAGASSNDSVDDVVKHSTPAWLENEANALLDEVSALGSVGLKGAIRKSRESLYE